MNRSVIYLLLSVQCALMAAQNSIGVYESVATGIVDTTNPAMTFLTPSEQKIRQMVIQQSSPGLYNPIKEGMQGDKLLLSVDGIRMTNALFRSGPNQYFSWIPRVFVQAIDEDAAARTTLNNGFGGEINQILGIAKSYGELGYDSYNNALQATAAYKGAEAAVGLHATTTDDYHDSNGEVAHSDYNQKALFAESTHLDDHTFRLLLSQSDDLPRTDNYAIGSPYDYELQRYMLLSDKIYLGEAHGMTLSYQRFEERTNADGSIVETLDDIAGVDYRYLISPEWMVALSDYYELIAYDANDFTYNTFTAQLSYAKTFGNIRVLGGYTFSRADLAGDMNKDFIAHGGVARVEYGSFYGSVTQGYRFPSLINLAKSLITEKGIDLPNAALDPETSTTFAIGYQDTLFHMKLYYRVLNDLIVRTLQAEPVNGADAYQTLNADSGTMYGAVAGVRYNVGELKSNLYLEYSYGKTDADYISKITPFHGSLLLEYHGFFSEYLFAMKGLRMSESDKRDVRIVDHNHGYNILNIGYARQWGAHRVKAQLNNLADAEGRSYASSVDWPKRSVSLRYTYLF